jgi:uracil-DNA glycosylase family 4
LGNPPELGILRIIVNSYMYDKIDRIINEILLIQKGEPFFSALEKRISKLASVGGERKEKVPKVEKLGISSKESLMRMLESEILECKKCPLHLRRTNAVPGTGNYNAKLMIIGEGPGRDEDIQGKPFVGKAGKLLTQLLSEIGISREEVYITNVVKCRPPDNRVPEESEIEACRDYLRRQIEIINPKIILLLGSTALKAVIGEKSITKVRGEEIEIDGIIYLPTFHPAAVLRDESNKLPQIREDFRKLKELYEKLA